jgi:hypothetical protein
MPPPICVKGLELTLALGTFPADGSRQKCEMRPDWGANPFLSNPDTVLRASTPTTGHTQTLRSLWNITALASWVFAWRLIPETKGPNTGRDQPALAVIFNGKWRRQQRTARCSHSTVTVFSSGRSADERPIMIFTGSRSSSQSCFCSFQ